MVVHDKTFAAHAKDVARALVLETLPLEAIPPGGLAAIPNLFVDVNLRDLKIVEMVRQTLGTPPAKRQWIFAIEVGAARRLWQAQANALGATRHLRRENAFTDLRAAMSITVAGPISRAGAQSLRSVAGGGAILEGGRELAHLFDGVLSGQKQVGSKASIVGRDVVESVRSVGTNQWLGTVRTYHEGTFQHCLLVTGTAASYAARYMPGQQDAVTLTTAALLHDVGKAIVPLHILDKPGNLTAAEFAMIQTHPGAGYDYLAAQGGIDEIILDGVRHHHEALDGSGYPDGLKGEEILPLTRILTVCDIFAALVERRPYRPPMSAEDAMAVLVQMAIENKLDYATVRNLGAVFEMSLPGNLTEVLDNISQRLPTIN